MSVTKISRNRLIVEEDLRVKLSLIKPDFEALFKGNEQHVSNNESNVYS